MEIRYNTSENHKNTAVAIQEQLKPLGIEVTLLNTDTKTHYGYPRAEGRLRRRPRRLDRRLQGSRDLPRHLAQGERQQLLRLQQPEFEELMDKAAAAGGKPEERMKLLAEAERVLVDDLGNIPLLYYSYKNLVSRQDPGLRGQRHGRASVALHQQGLMPGP